jgi:hypothetical protein
MMRCHRTPDGGHRWGYGACNTPLVIAFDDAPVLFTAAAGTFTIGTSRRTEWVSSKTPWLALDRDGSGCIENQSELFGADDEAADGFEKLARYDDNHDGAIDAADAVFTRLVLWSDRDQDRVCTATEIAPLMSSARIALTPTRRAPTYGSYEGSWATISFSGRAARVVDVYLAPLD